MSHAYLITLKTLLCTVLSTVTARHTKVEIFCSILSWFVSECLECLFQNEALSFLYPSRLTGTVLHKINTTY